MRSIVLNTHVEFTYEDDMSEKGFYVDCCRNGVADNNLLEIVQRLAHAFGWSWDADKDDKEINVFDDESYVFFFEEEKTFDFYDRAMFDGDFDEYDVYQLPDEFSELLDRLKGEVMIEGHPVRYNFDEELIQIGCRKIPFDTVRRIADRIDDRE